VSKSTLPRLLEKAEAILKQATKLGIELSEAEAFREVDEDATLNYAGAIKLWRTTGDTLTLILSVDGAITHADGGSTPSDVSLLLEATDCCQAARLSCYALESVDVWELNIPTDHELQEGYEIFNTLVKNLKRSASASTLNERQAEDALQKILKAFKRDLQKRN